MLVYDEHPYADPVKHYWFASSPVTAISPAPGGPPILANWNVDKSLSPLPIRRLHRVEAHQVLPLASRRQRRPRRRGRKSEKQGAISVLFPGPLMPGDRRTMAFCYAGAVAGSSGAAKAAAMVKLAACKGPVDLPQRRVRRQHPPARRAVRRRQHRRWDGCSAACEEEFCGDGKVTGGEECDDGNTADDDGCSAACKTEICGDGIVQSGEVCDDGDESNTDACLNDCTAASCGDGYVRMCDADAGEPCDKLCGAGAWCLTGTLTITNDVRMIQGMPTAGNLTHLVGQTVGIGFSSTSSPR